jgi:NADH-quinone oxidoreductase subunit M
MLSSVGLPGLNGFVGEFTILVGSFNTARWWVVVATTGVIIAALYLLWAYQRVFHGQPDEENKSFAELRWKEGLVLLPFIGVIVFTGIYPKPMFDRIEPSVQVVVDRVAAATDANTEGGPVFVPAPPGEHGESEEHAEEPADAEADGEATVTTEAGH